MADIYGGFSLQRKDSDTNQVWGGAKRDISPNPNYVAELQQDLKELGFRIVGESSDGVFGRNAEWAVREFQIYTKMEYVARDIAQEKTSLLSLPYFSRLVEQKNNDRYSGAVSGVVNLETAKRIKAWKEKGWRCPVIACAFEISNNERTATVRVSNLWAGDESYEKPKSTRVYVRDFTRYYCQNGEVPTQVQVMWVDPSSTSPFRLKYKNNTSSDISERTVASLQTALSSLGNFKVIGTDNSPWEICFIDSSPTVGTAEILAVEGIPADKFHLATVPEWLVVGDYAKYSTLGGPRSLPPNHCPSQYGGELLPETLIGKTAAEVDNSQTLESTYRVVRAVSEVECLGFFDSLNAYDTGLISLGPCHWILGLKSNAAIAAGELGAFLSFLKNKSEASFEKVIGQFGVQTINQWDEAPGNGAKLFNKSLRTYTTWLQLQTETGFAPLPKTWREASWFKTWHWFYRFAMAGRTQFADGATAPKTNSLLANYRLAMWDMARIRLRNILTAEWPKINGETLIYEGEENAAGPKGPRTARIGDVFTSELATALLLRWHINVPGTLLKNGKASKHLITILRQVDSGAIADLVARIDTNDTQATLTRQLIDYVKSDAGPLTSSPAAKNNLVKTLEEIQNWPGEKTVRQQRGYRLKQSSGDTNLDNLIREKLSTAKRSFSFYKEGIDVAQLPISDRKVQYAAIPISTPVQTDRPSFFRFGVALLAKLFDDTQEIAATVPINELAVTLFVPPLPANETIPDNDPSLDGLPPTIVQEQPLFLGFKFPVIKIEGRELQPADLVTDINSLSDEDFILFNETTDPHNQSSEIISLNGGIDKQVWQLDLSTLAEFLGFKPEVYVILENGQVRLDVTLDDQKVSLPRPFNWSFAANGLDTTQWTTFEFDVSDRSDLEVTHIKFDITDKTLPLDYGLPFLLTGKMSGTLDLEVTLDRKWQLAPKLDLTVAIEGDSRIDLGSPIAQLSLPSGGFTVKFDPSGGLSFILNEDIQPKLHLDLFEKFDGQDVVVNNIWSGEQGQLITLPLPQLIGLSEEVRTITWQNSFPTVSQELMNHLLGNLNDIAVQTGRRLQSLAGGVLGAVAPTQVTFDKCSTNFFEFTPGELKVCLKLKVAAQNEQNEQKTILEGEGNFVFLYDVEGNRALFRPGAFRCTGDSLIRSKTSFNSSFSDLISLHIPVETAFKFICDPKDPKLEYDEPAQSQNGGPPSRITIRVPAALDNNPKDSTFTFELEKFALQSAGFDLKGAIRSEKVPFGEFFAEPLAVKSPERNNFSNGKTSTTGWLEFKNSTLVKGSLQAAAKLKYFDDATGTFTLALAQDPVNKQLDAAGSLEVSGLSEFHIDRLYMACQIAMFHLGVKYLAGQWSVDAWMTGRIKFAPPRGQSAGNMKELSDLFSGVECGFERLNPLALGSEKVEVTFPVKRFEFADVFDVDLQGVSFEKPTATLKDELMLLGNITIKQLPGVEASLRFGNITLIDGNPPTFTVDHIGAQFSVPGGFRLDGDFEFIEFETESGFVGAFAVTTETLPRISGLLKLTRVRTRDRQAWVPSIAVYLEADIDVALFAGFFLRSIGVGVGIYQALAGLEPDNSRPLPQKIIQLVNSPTGLPQPRRPEAWKPAPPEQVNSGLNWMFVASGLLTLGKLKNDQPHSLAASILLALDQDLQLVVGVNIWLFASPQDTQSTEFAYRPVGRGAVGLSVKEKRLFAMFRTLKNPKLRNDAPPILKEVLSKVETSLLFSADQKGMLVEVGWPWETRIKGHALGELIKGEMTSGFRFGIYQGVISFGLNYAVTVALEAERRIGFDTKFGSAEAYLSAKGKGTFRASFAGALDRSFRVYLLGDVRINATLSLTAQASVSKKITRWFKFKLTIKATIDISISAALTAAMEPGPNIGFEGEASVAISVSGYRLAGRLTFAYRREAIASTRKNIERLLPPRLGGNGIAAFALQLASFEDLPQGWNYRFTKVKNNKAVRVLLFPKPGTLYPLPALPKTLSKNDTQVFLTDFSTNFSVQSILNLLETSPIDLNSLKTLLQPHLTLPSEIKGVNTLNQDILASLGAIKGWRVGSDSDVAGEDYLLIPFEETVRPSSSIFSIANTDTDTTIVSTIVTALSSGDLTGITATLKPFFGNNSKPLPDPIDGINALSSETVTALDKNGQQGWRIGSDATSSDRDYALILMLDGSLSIFFNPERIRTVIRVFFNPQRPRFALKLKKPELFKGFVGNQNVNPVDAQLFWGENLDRELPDSPKDEKIYVRDVLGSLNQKPEKTHFQGTEEINDPRPLNPSPEHTDDETASVATTQVNSPNLTRDTDYDRALSDAWSKPQESPRSFLVSYKDSADKIIIIEQAIKKLIELAQRQKKKDPQDPLPEDSPEELKKLFEGQTEKPPNKIFVTQLTDSEVEPFQAQAVWQVDPGKDEPADSNGFVPGYYILQIDEGLKVIANYYNESKVEEPLSPGMLLAELLELMADETASVDTVVNEGFAPYLNLVLEFELTKDLENKFDPVPELLDLEQGIRIEEIQQTLESLLGKGVEPPEYDLVAGPVHQSNEQICLTWLFLREDLAQPQLEVTRQDSADPFATYFAAYTELERFVIIRRNFSSLSDEPREIAIYPSWIQGKKDETGKTGLIRPQFQFVDEQLEDVKEGNQLQYEVIAKACDRILASCLINTIRQTVQPLPPLGQALALHDLNSTERSIEIVVAVESVAQEKFKLTADSLGKLKTVLRKNLIADNVIDGIINKVNVNSLLDQTFPQETQFRKELKELMSPGELARFEKYILAQARLTVFEPLFPSDELRLRYRLTQAKTVGSYGFESRPEVTIQWSNGLPSRENDPNFPQIEFASVRGSYQLPWEETADTAKLPLLNSISWELVEETLPGQPPQYGYRKRFTEKQLRESLGKWREGAAIEFYVGREERANQQPGNTKKPIKRSPLLKCRHAIIPVTTTPLTDDSSSNSLDLGRGNFVEALEYLPEDEPQLEWLNPKRVIENQIDYPDNDEQKTFSLTLAWRHDLSGRRGYDDPMLLGYDDPSANTPGLKKRFDPVIGYRLYRHDAYDPNPFPANAEVFIRVIPDLLYRAQPASIEVLGLADKPDPTIARPRKPTNVDEATIDRLDYGLIAPIADWIPTQEKKTDLKTEPLNDLADGTSAPVPFVQPEKLPGGQVWLHQAIQKFITKLKEKLQSVIGEKLQSVIGLDNPLELKAEQSVTDELLISELQTLQTELNGKTDPYGWRTAEAFGLSCECRFQKSTGQFISTETVIKAIDEIKNDNDFPLVSVAIFLAEDDQTPLNVIRLVYARKIRDWTEPKRAFDLDIAFAHRYLGTKVKENQYDHVTLTEPQRQRLLDDKSGFNLKQWLDNLNARLATSQLINESETEAISYRTFFRYDARTSQNVSQADNLPPQAVVALPINREGRIEHRLSVPDRWAHQYEISLELVRRYDQARGRAFGGLPEPEHRITIDVMRSQELVPHNLLATPLNGGIQAIVFRHPAAFAAAASAVQAAHIQYSGQTVHLERQIDPNVLGVLKALYNRFTVKNPALDWQLYQKWLFESGKEDVTPGPKLYNPDGTIAKPKTLDPLQPIDEGTLPAIYGADRYVFPDLPGYYQYRVVAYSTAGRRHSEPKATPWISPLYEAGDDARQRPVAESCNRADYNASASQKTLKLQIPLIHPRQHLLEAIRGLWVDADDWFEINTPAIALRFGSLPDLYLTYQLYLWINKDVGDGATRVYLPLLKIKPPSLDEAQISNEDNWFVVESQATGLQPVTALATITQVEGQLVFEIDLDLNDPKCQPLLEALNALKTADVKEIISLAVQRGGVWSKLQPPFL